MLNYVAFYLISFLLRTPGALQAPGSNKPKSPPDRPAPPSSRRSPICSVSGTYRLHFGFILVILATIWVWYLLNRSSMGFRSERSARTRTRRASPAST